MSATLAQFVASIGGIRYDVDGNNHGEITRIRDVNRYLRGKNSVFRPDGLSQDQVCEAAQSEGYPVDHWTFLEALEQDAFAWANGKDAYRVLRDYELEEQEIWPFELEGGPEPTIEPDRPICGVCGGTSAHLEQHGEAICYTCREWSIRITDPLRYELEYCEQVPLDYLSMEVQEVLIDSLEVML